MNFTQLEQRVLDHKLAYELGRPTISDFQFDALELQLKKENPNSPVLSMVGFAEFKADSTHKIPMLSQNKALTLDELMKWLNAMCKKGYTEFSASEKADGMSCSLHYLEGRLSKAVSRGDGEVGTDITAKVSYIVPVTLPMPFTGEVRGELLLSNSNFAALNAIINAAGTDAYENQRNGVVGVLNSDDIAVDRIALLSFKPFRLLTEEMPEEANVFFQTADSVTSDMYFLESKIHHAT